VGLIAESWREQRPYSPVYGAGGQDLVLSQTVPAVLGVRYEPLGVGSLGVINLVQIHIKR